jgi:hypothetical protein
MGLLPTNSGGTSTPLMVHALSFGQSDTTILGNTTLSGNLCYWYPITIPFDYSIKRFGWGNHTSTSTRTINIGIYTTDGTKLYETGNTTFTTPTASVPHYITPATPVFLPAGTYYIAFRSGGFPFIAFDYSSAESASLDAGQLIEQQTGSPPATLPTDMSNAVRATAQHVPVVTLHRT